jgi:hypothetical protein
VKVRSGRPGSLGALCATYYQSDDFNLLGPSSQRVRRQILNRVCEAHGQRIADEMGVREVKAVRGPIVKPEAANGVVKALRAVFSGRHRGRDHRTQPGEEGPLSALQTAGGHPCMG